MNGFEESALAVSVRAGEDDESGFEGDVGVDVVAEAA